MKRITWVICERTNRWAAALRVQVARMPQWKKIPPRFVEVRSLSELTARLQECPAAIAFMEVRSGNFAEVLRWIGDQQAWRPRPCILALLDESLRPSVGINSGKYVAETQQVADALREAGATDIATSPRYLHQILEIATQHAAARQRAASYNTAQPLLAWALEQLPWQSA